MKGLSNDSLEFFFKKAKIPIQGVFSINTIPNHIWNKKRYCFIVNTSPNFIKFGHFITIIKNPNHVLILDPLALNLWNNFILHKSNLPIIVLHTPIQSSNSAHCGLYSMVFILYYFYRPQFMLEFYTGYSDYKLKENDNLCAFYIKKIILSRTGSSNKQKYELIRYLKNIHEIFLKQ